jgi:hypothetical protein
LPGLYLLLNRLERPEHVGACRPAVPVATFTVDGIPSALVTARLAAENAIEAGHGSLDARPYLTRLLGLGPARARASLAIVVHHGKGADRLSRAVMSWNDASGPTATAYLVMTSATHAFIVRSTRSTAARHAQISGST